MKLAILFLLLFARVEINKADDAEYPIAGKLSESELTVRNLDGEKRFKLFYYRGDSMQPIYLWKTVQVNVTFRDGNDDHEYSIYQNANKSEVIKAYEDNRGFFNKFVKKWSPTWRPSSYISPFSSIYVGIETDGSYNIGVKVRNVDLRLAAVFFTGIVLFFSANRLSRSTLAFYAGGTSIGVIGSLLVVVFLLYRLVPKKSMAYSVLLGGWSLMCYVGYLVWTHLYTVMTEYYRYVAIYLVTAASISFAVSYLYGPPQGVRTLNLIQWFLQATGLAMVYFGSQIPALSVIVMMGLILIFNIPKVFGKQLRWIRYRFFPPTRRLLTEDEYLTEGARETHRALEELRKYCQSPDCNSWKTVSRLQSPKEFAEFVSGQRSHIADDEILAYSNESFLEDLRDDEDDEDDDVSGATNSVTGGDILNRSYELRHRNGVQGGRFTEYFNGRHQFVPSSAPPKSSGNGRLSPRLNRSFE